MSSDETFRAAELGLCDGRVSVSKDAVRMLAEMQGVAHQLQAVLETQALVDRAVGILMGANGGTETEAMARLVVQSRARRQKLGVVARDIIDEAAGCVRRVDHEM